LIQEKVDTWLKGQTVARYGRALRHPLCQAALSFWQLNGDCLDALKDFLRLEGVIKNAEQNKVNVRAQVRRLRKARKFKEAKQAAANLRTVHNLLRKMQSIDQSLRKGIPSLLKLRAVAEKRFAHDSIAALRRGNFNAFNALERAWKRYDSGDSQFDHRTLGLLALVRDKACKRAWAKGGATAGYREAALGAYRMLSDEDWPQLSAREVHSHLVEVKAFLPPRDEEQINEQLHEVRRLARRLGIKLSADRRGRKPRSKNRIARN
jgi:hypothetical protein